MRGNIGTVYNSYTNGEKERAVCRPSRTQGERRGFDRRKECVEMADAFGIENVWSGIYEACQQHGDFTSERSKDLSIWSCECEFKIFVRRWWKEHNQTNSLLFLSSFWKCKTQMNLLANPQYCYSIIRGTMTKMKQLTDARGSPISDYYMATPGLY